MNLAFLASYNGSSAHAITDACLEGDLIAAPSLLISNNPTAKALEWAENKGLKCACLNNTTHPDAELLDEAIAQKLRDHKINIVILSGYMKLIGAQTMAAVEGRILNIHPALLPKYGGQGMYGMNVHRAVKAAGERESGASVHLVNGAYDEGRILAQQRVALSLEDSAEDIAAKVQAIEPALYIKTLRQILKGEIEI